MDIKTVLHDLLPVMRETGAENPLRELRLMVAHVLGIPYGDVFFHEDRALTADQVARIQQAVSLRSDHMPLAKIIGYKEFWGLSFRVTEDTLDPRPDSETLLEVLSALYPDHQQSLEILDLGTGSGCLLLSALHDYPQAHGVGVDLSPKALHVAQENAHQLGLACRCDFVEGSWFDPVLGTFHVILANPPYIVPGTPLSLETQKDPPFALYAPEKGLLHYRLILEGATPYLKEGGHLIFEIGQGQEKDIETLAQGNGFSLVLSRKDIQGCVRCLVFQKV